MAESINKRGLRHWTSSLTSWMGALMNLGARESYSDSYNSKVRLYNKMNLLVCLAMVPIIIYDLARGYYPGAMIAGSMFFTTGFSYFLMYKGKFFLVAWGSIIIVTIGIIFLILFYGRDIGGELTFIGIGLSCIVIFDSWRSRLILLTWVYCAYLISEVLLQYLAPFTPEPQIFPVYFVVFGTNFLLTLVMVAYFTKQGENLEQEATDLMEDLTIRNKELEIANSDLTQFAYAASHHFKSPLKNMSNLLGLIERKLPNEILAQHGNYLEMILADSKHLYRLVEDILTYSTLDSSAFHRDKPVNMSKVIERVTNNLSEELISRNVTLVVHELAIIHALTTHLELMLQILIQNGIQYNESENPSIEISSTTMEDGSVSLKISDNGIGIPVEYQEQIFDMFERLHPQNEYPGTGIGLTVCRRIMDGYHGRITVESSQGRGTTMTLFFPPEEEN